MLKAIFLGFMAWITLISVVNADTMPIQLSVLIDPDGHYSLNDVQAHSDFIPQRQNAFSGGYTRHVHWFKVELNTRPTGSQPLTLEIHPTYLDHLICYYQDADGQWLSKQMGDHYPFSSRELAYRGFAFNLPTEAFHAPVYFRLQTGSSSVFNLNVWSSESSFQRKNLAEYAVLGIYYGILFLLLVINAGVALFTRDRVFILYFIYLFTSTLLTLGTNGVVAQFAFPTLPVISDQLSMVGSGLVFLAGSIFYQRVMLITRQKNPVIYWANWLYFVVSFLILISVVVGYYTEWMVVAMNTMLVMLILWLVQSWRIWRSGEASLWLLVAHVMTLMGGITVSLALNGFISGNFWFINGFQMGLLGTMLALQIVMFQRISAVYQQQLDAMARAKIAELHHRQQDSFLSMLTHELKTPLSIINMVLANPKASERIKQHALTSVQNICDIVDHCTESQRVTYHHYQANAERLELIELIKQQLEYRPIDKPIAWQIEVEDSILMSDEGYLRVIVNNLLVNAEKYAKPESTVVIALTAQNQQICFSVRNAVEARHLPDAKKLYDPYYRAPSAHKVSGSGLGLFIVKSLVERLSGQIHYNSHHGSDDLLDDDLVDDYYVSFTICLPRVRL